MPLRFPQSGSRSAVLITVLVILLLLSLLGACLVTLLFSRTTTNLQELARMQAFYLAEAGLAQALYELRNDIDADGDGLGTIPPTPLGKGIYRAEHDFTTGTITAVGEVEGIKRTIEVRYGVL